MGITLEQQADGTFRQVDDPPKRFDIEQMCRISEWVKVVRCRDCKHYTEDEMEYYHFCGSWCEQVEPDGFCAWGERKDMDE